MVVLDGQQTGALHLQDVMQAGSSQHRRQLEGLKKKLSSDDPINIQFTSVISRLSAVRLERAKASILAIIRFSSIAAFEVTTSFYNVRFTGSLLMTVFIPGNDGVSQGRDPVSF